MSDDENPARLRRDLSLLDVVIFGASSAIGASIFSVLSPAARIAGPALLPAIGVSAIPMLVFALIYAALASVLPMSGAAYEWPRRFVSPLVGFMTAWLRILGNMGLLAVLALVFFQYLHMTEGVPERLAMLGLITLVALCNYFGIRLVATTQRLLMTVMIVALAIYVAAGFRVIDPANLHWNDMIQPAPMVAAIPLLVGLYMGIEASVEVGAEVRNARIAIPLGIAVTSVATLVIYLLVATVTVGTLGSTQLAASQAPLFDAAQLSLGRFGQPIILAAALVSLLKALNASFTVFSRFIFAMGQSRDLPRALATIHPRYGTPSTAILACYGMGVAGIFLPTDLVFLFLAINIPTMFKYLANCVAGLRVARRHPELLAAAPFSIGPRSLATLSCLGVIMSVLIIVVGWEADARPYWVISVWALAGWIYWTMRRRLSSRPLADT